MERICGYTIPGLKGPVSSHLFPEVSAEVHRFSGKDQALAFVLGLLKESGVSDAPHLVVSSLHCHVEGRVNGYDF
jgi:hypothetical protein